MRVWGVFLNGLESDTSSFAYSINYKGWARVKDTSPGPNVEVIDVTRNQYMSIFHLNPPLHISWRLPHPVPKIRAIQHHPQSIFSSLVQSSKSPPLHRLRASWSVVSGPSSQSVTQITPSSICPRYYEIVLCPSMRRLGLVATSNSSNRWHFSSNLKDRFFTKAARRSKDRSLDACLSA